MKPIQPVHFQATGAKVANLQEGLQILIRRQRLPKGQRDILLQRLAAEQTFGNATLDIVRLYQDQVRNRSDTPKKIKDNLVANGDVDQLTARALNWLLTKYGVLNCKADDWCVP